MTTRRRAMDGTFERKAPPPTHYHAGTWNTPRPGTDCDDCRETYDRNPARVYLFGIGSPAWCATTGHTINDRGVPIPTRKPR